MSDRPTRLLAELTEPGADLILVTSLVNIRYLTGFSGSHAAALIGPDTRVFLTDFRYDEQSAAEVDPSFDRIIAATGFAAELEARLPQGELRLAFEDHQLTVHAHSELREKLPGRVQLVAAGTPVQTLRKVKEPGEIDKIRAAQQLADDALRELMAQGFAGRTERQVATALEDAMRARGASGPSFGSIVATGPHGALPHATPRDVEIAADQLVVVDWGALLDGYCSDCTRTFATGDISETARNTYDLVLEAQRAGVEAVRPGIGGKEADGTARAIIDAAGHADHFGHSLGHGVGLEVHEGPTLSQRSGDTLAPGNVVTVEPGVYLPGEVGVRIEDLCVVTEAGHEILTGIPKELIDVG